MSTHRRYWQETGRRGFTDGDLPDGPLVEVITAREFFEAEAASLACGWPHLHYPKNETLCPCGWIFPGQHGAQVHKSADDEALS